MHVKLISINKLGASFPGLVSVSGCLDAQLLLEKLQQSVGLVHLLDLKHSDIRMDLVTNLRNEGVKFFIVDVGSNLLNNFFDQAMKSGIVHAKTSFLSSSLVNINFTSTKSTKFYEY